MRRLRSGAVLNELFAAVAIKKAQNPSIANDFEAKRRSWAERYRWRSGGATRLRIKGIVSCHQ